MAKNSEIIVKDVTIKTMNINGIDYICITDIAKQKNIVDPNGVVANWMRNRNTIEYLGLWETLHNTEFNPLEFEGFRKEAGLNAFTLSPTRWIEATSLPQLDNLVETAENMNDANCGNGVAPIQLPRFILSWSRNINSICLTKHCFRQR